MGSPPHLSFRLSNSFIEDKFLVIGHKLFGIFVTMITTHATIDHKSFSLYSRPLQYLPKKLTSKLAVRTVSSQQGMFIRYQEKTGGKFHQNGLTFCEIFSYY